MSKRRFGVCATIWCGVMAALPLAAWPQEPAAPRLMRPISTTRPVIPDEVCQQRLSGWVELDFAVMPDGRVAEVVVTGAEPKGAFESAAAASVAEWVYPPQAAPVKMHLRLPMTYSECRAEQLRAVDPSTVAAKSPEECQAIAAEAKKAGERFAAAESRRAVLRGKRAQIYSAPNPQCHMAGKFVETATPLNAYVEYRGFSLVSGVGATEDSAVWVWSSQLKDVAP